MSLRKAIDPLGIFLKDKKKKQAPAPAADPRAMLPQSNFASFDADLDMRRKLASKRGFLASKVAGETRSNQAYQSRQGAPSLLGMP